LLDFQNKNFQCERGIEAKNVKHVLIRQQHNQSCGTKDIIKFVKKCKQKKTKMARHTENKLTGMKTSASTFFDSCNSFNCNFCSSDNKSPIS